VPKINVGDLGGNMTEPNAAKAEKGNFCRSPPPNVTDGFEIHFGRNKENLWVLESNRRT
jgi:hypothetical protein